jgi:hypothetical protein
MAIFSDSDFIRDNYINLLSNKKLFINTLNWLTDNENSVLPANERGVGKISPLILTAKDSKTIFILTVFLFPLTIIFIGFYVYYIKSRIEH